MSFMGIKRVVYTSGVNEPSDELPLSFFLSLSLSLLRVERGYLCKQIYIFMNIIRNSKKVIEIALPNAINYIYRSIIDISRYTYRLV